MAGERRYRAHQLLGHETIQAVVTTGDPAEVAIIENVQREDLHPLDEANAYVALMGLHGYTQEQVGQIVGKGRRTISDLVRLTTLPQSIQEECQTSGIGERLSKSLLLEIARLETPEAQLAAWADAKAQKSFAVRDMRSVKHDRVQKKSRQTKTNPVQQTLIHGHQFLTRLRTLSRDQIPVEPGMVRELKNLHADIGTALFHIDRSPSPDAHDA